MRRLLLVGAGGFGREVLSWVRELPAPAREWDSIALLDDDPDALTGYEWAGTVAGPATGFTPSPEDVLAITIGDPRTKLEVASDLARRGARFATLRHPSAVVGENVRLGDGVILCPMSCITSDARVGDHVHLNVSSSLGHDSAVGDGLTLSAHCDVTGFARLGRGVFLGSHASVLPSVEVGDFARIGAGAVVVRRVPPGATVFGNPARVITEGT